MDIISKVVSIKKTLTDKVLKNFSRVKLRKASVKVPRLRIKRENVSQKKDDSMPVSSIINILIKAAVEKAKKERKEKNLEEDKSYTILKEDRKLIFNGGYGTVSKGYGTAPHTSYVDYGKLFSYLGKFKSQSPYENMAEHVTITNKSLEDKGFTLIGTEAMEKGTFYIRYFNPKGIIDKTSLVPLPGMNSAEWEQFKMWMRLDTAMYLLKISTS